MKSYVKSTATRKPVLFADTEDLAKQFVAELEKVDTPVSLDTEFELDTTGEVVLFSYSWARGVRRVVEAKYLPLFGHILTDKRRRFVYQNYKADADVLKKLGYNMDGSFHADIMVLSWLIDENALRHGLKEQSRRFLGWYRKEYSTLFSYIPAGKKKPIVMSPKQVMYGPLPLEAVQAVWPDMTITEDDHEIIQNAQAVWRQRMIDYSGDDAESTIGLYHHHRRVLEKTGYWPTYLSIDRPFTLTLLRCEERGVRLDIPRLQQIQREVVKETMRTQHVFRALSGKPDINLNSNPQLQKLLFEELHWDYREDLVTPTGNPQISGEALEWWAEEKGYKLADVLLMYRSVSKLRGTFIDAVLAGTDDDGRLRSDFNQIGTVTGRISSRKRTKQTEVRRTLKNGTEKVHTKKIRVGANLQNFPTSRKDSFGIRGVFVPLQAGDELDGKTLTKNYVMVVNDFTGFELYMAIWNAAKFVPHSEMLKFAREDANLHAVTAYRMGILPKLIAREAKAMYDARDWGALKKLVKNLEDGRIYDIAKRMNFNCLYGGRARMLARLSGEDYNDERVLEKWKGLRNGWNECWPEMPVYQDKIVKFGYKHGFVQTISGRQCHVGEGLSTIDICSCMKYGCLICSKRQFWERKCMNTPCQGSAADIVKASMNLIERDPELRALKNRLLFQVHDELIQECPEKNAPRVLVRSQELMQTPYADKLGFILPVDGKYEKNWLLAKG